MTKGKILIFNYMNHRGEMSRRSVLVKCFILKSTEYYPDPGWILTGFDLEKKEERDFAVKNIKGILEIDKTGDA